MGNFIMPENINNYNGKERKVGYELEFSNINMNEILSLLKETYSLKEKKINSFFYKLESEYGDFVLELDFELLTKQKIKTNAIDFFEKVGIQIDEKRLDEVENILGTISKDLVPYEISTPPIPLSKMQLVDDLSTKLTNAGAHGTKKRVYNAFGLHINVELISLKAKSILNYLRTYVILQDFLNKDAKVDIARKITPYIDNFPKEYILKILNSKYNPNMDDLIDDYLYFNPTRNRSLDMLPVFAYIDEKRVREKLPKEKIKPRPAFHYRLSNSLVDENDWKISDEWNRWLLVENLANNEKNLKLLSNEYIEYLNKPINLNRWVERVEKWLKNH
ncbi:hypothetical protein CPG38_12140 [Malaciobacter marinus]|uniref:amidoligase family protein n=1 Tax=Malaciobacter marinus TaxID=505249 RepID=UPI000C08228A|nr:amidoligase family protein [Malaciobacter marinus]PHO11603.1 hypothetical protein CPG38_12140 [Malaciobacter marinus]